MQNDLERFRALFFEEAAEHVANMETALLELEHAPDNQELLNHIFRSAHSIKGACGTFGLDDIARFTHSLENLLDRMRAGAISPSPERIDLLLRSSDVLRGLLKSARSGEPPPPGGEEALAELRGILGVEPAAASVPADRPRLPAEASAGEYRVQVTPDADLLRQGMDPLLLLRDLALTGEILAVGLDMSRLPPLIELDPELCYLAWSIHLKTEQSAEQIREVFAYVEDSVRVAIDAVVDADRRPVEAESRRDPAGILTHPPLARANDLIEAALVLLRAEACLAKAVGDFAASPVFSSNGLLTA